VVTALSYGLPERHAATGVGLAFLTATYFLVLRGDARHVRDHGLSLGGLLEPGAIDMGRMVRDGGRSLAWSLGLAAMVFPLFWIGFVWWWHPRQPFVWIPPESPLDEVLGQVMVIALPEEAFYRGYVQSALDRAWAKKQAEPSKAAHGRLRLLGADVGWAIPITSAMFALGHFLTDPHPQRLAVFFPALLFGWLRCRTGGIGAALMLHAMANMFSATLGRGYGLFGH
jgi:membrane protease YdiL (CAAX protease family)